MVPLGLIVNVNVICQGLYNNMNKNYPDTVFYLIVKMRC